MRDTIVATYETAVNGRVYVWASGSETWQREDGTWGERRITPPLDGLTDRTAEMLREGDVHKGGWLTPCDDWVDRHTIDGHAATCSTCRMVGGMAD